MAKMVQISAEILDRAWLLLEELHQDKDKEARQAIVYEDYKAAIRCSSAMQQIDALLEDIEAALDAKE